MMQGRLRRQLAAAFVLLFVLAKAGDAQLSTASVSGVVRDSAGLVVAHATVKLRSVATSVETTTTTNGSGSYAIVSITPGAYTIEATAQGFNTEQLNQFNLTVGQEAAIDFALSPGVVSSVVTVQGSAPIL